MDAIGFYQKKQSIPMTPASPETREQAMKVASATQKPGQTKEQTRLIAQGIEKGIAEFKKQQKAKARERDKLRKRQLKDRQILLDETELEQELEQDWPDSAWYKNAYIPWSLLLVSWLGFAAWLLAR
ncbi:DUF2956 domain-containing protein [Shewanella cyperi]|uniref:DUF2956 domain-containing protein n=1 Tax=Shewanella cyperi TaxID=2814292 RepID=UPI001D17F729|nr:DUF2956 domain-containing protein [Shewanella cyperi]